MIDEFKKIEAGGELEKCKNIVQNCAKRIDDCFKKVAAYKTDYPEDSVELDSLVSNGLSYIDGLIDKYR